MSQLNLDASNETFGEMTANWSIEVVKFLERHGYKPVLFDEMMKRPRTAGLILDAMKKIIEADMYVMLESIVLDSDGSGTVAATLERGVELHVKRANRYEDGGQAVQVIEYPKMKTRAIRIPPVGWVSIGYGVEMSLDYGQVFLVRRPRPYTPAPQSA